MVVHARNRSVALGEFLAACSRRPLSVRAAAPRPSKNNDRTKALDLFREEREAAPSAAGGTLVIALMAVIVGRLAGFACGMIVGLCFGWTQCCVKMNVSGGRGWQRPCRLNVVTVRRWVSRKLEVTRRGER